MAILKFHPFTYVDDMPAVRHLQDTFNRLFVVENWITKIDSCFPSDTTNLVIANSKVR